MVSRTQLDLTLLSPFLLTEVCSTENADEICANEYIYHSEKKGYQRYFDKMTADGSISVAYSCKKYNGRTLGRFYPQTPFKVLTSQFSAVRSATCGETQVDIDAVKCHMMLLKAVAEDHGLDHQVIVKYLNDIPGHIARLDITDVIVRAYNEKNTTDLSSADLAKQIYTALLYGGAPANLFKKICPFNIAAVKLFRKEISTLTNKVLALPLFKEWVEDYRHGVLQEKKKKASPGSCLSIVLQTLESLNVICLMRLFQARGLNVRSYIFDGFQVDTDPQINEILAGWNAQECVQFIAKAWKRSILDYEALNLPKCCETDPGSSLVASTDREAAELVLDALAGRLISCHGEHFLNQHHVWLEDKDIIYQAIGAFVVQMEIRKEDGKPYSQNYNSAMAIVKTVMLLALDEEYQDNDLSLKFQRSTLGRLCFLNGVLNLRSKEFHDWESAEAKSVYTRVIINRDWTGERNDLVIQEAKEKVWDAIFGPQSAKALAWFARGMAGEIGDKAWGKFIGARNCGKGVLERAFFSAFGDYIVTLNSNSFLFERASNATDTEKTLGFLIPLQGARLAFTQELKTDATNSGLKIDSSLIKKICSGGDTMTARRLHRNPIQFTVQARLMLMANDFPPLSEADCEEYMTSFKSATKFRSQEYKDERISDGACSAELDLIQLADPHIKAKVAQENWANALVFLMLDNYHPEPVAPDRCGLNGEDNIDSIIFKHFQFTGKDENTVTNKQLRDWLKKNGHTFSLTKLGIELEGRKAIKYRSESIRGFKRLKLMEHEPDSEVCGTPEA